MEERLAYRDDVPGSRRAPCLGCGRRVVMARDPHCLIGGRRDGSVLIAIDAEPQRSFATDVDLIYTDRDLFLLGVAHRECMPLARQRLEAKDVQLPKELPTLLIDDEIDELPELHNPPIPGQCAFCGSSDATSEHVFPQWISRELTKLAPFEITTEYGPRRLRQLDMTAPVCATCNHRWLSVLERDVQPVLAPLVRGEESTLSSDDQRLLAAWASKTTLMIDLGSGSPTIPTGFYYELRQHRSALRSHVIWIGAYLGSRKAVWAEHRGLRLGIEPEEPPNAFVTTFSVFRVVFQVVGHFTKGGASVADGRPLALGLWPIWPAEREVVSWPRDRFAYSDEGLADLAASIRSSRRAP